MLELVKKFHLDMPKTRKETNEKVMNKKFMVRRENVTYEEMAVVRKDPLKDKSSR